MITLFYCYEFGLTYNFSVISQNSLYNLSKTLNNQNFFILTLRKINVYFKKFHSLLIISLYFLKILSKISQKTLYNLSKSSLYILSFNPDSRSPWNEFHTRSCLDWIRPKQFFICQQDYGAKHEIDSYIFFGRNLVKMNLCAEKRRGEPLKMVAFSSTWIEKRSGHHSGQASGCRNVNKVEVVCEGKKVWRHFLLSFDIT